MNDIVTIKESLQFIEATSIGYNPDNDGNGNGNTVHNKEYFYELKNINKWLEDNRHFQYVKITAVISIHKKIQYADAEENNEHYLRFQDLFVKT